MKVKKQQRGFSLIELMITAMITVGLTGTVFYLLDQSQESFALQSSATSLQQNFRSALDLMTRDIQTAGAGMPHFLGPIAGSDGGTDTDGKSLPDEILVMYGKPDFTALSVNGPIASATNSFVAENPASGTASTFTNNSHYVLYTVTPARQVLANTTDLAEFNVFKLGSQSAVTNGVQLTPATTASVTLPAWSNLTNFPNSAVLRVVELDEVIQYRLNKTTRMLQRRRNGGQWVDIAPGIVNFQIRYRIERADTTVDPPVFTQVEVDQPGTSADNNRALIRSVLLTLDGEDEVRNQGRNFISQTVEITPRNLVLPGFTPNR